MPSSYLFTNMITTIDARSSKTPQKAYAGRNKWAKVPSELSPPSIFLWTDCLSKVNQSNERIDPAAPKPAVYPFPHPGLFMSTSSAEHCERYIVNWLVSRSAWINRVQTQICTGDIPTAQMWRDFLNALPSKLSSTLEGSHSAKMIQAAVNLFGEGFVDLHSSFESDSQSVVVWRDRELNLRSFTAWPQQVR